MNQRTEPMRIKLHTKSMKGVASFGGINDGRPGVLTTCCDSSAILKYNYPKAHVLKKSDQVYLGWIVTPRNQVNGNLFLALHSTLIK